MNKNLINNKLPKFFNVTIEYVTGEKEDFKCASWHYEQDFIEYLTTDNMFVQVIKSNIKTIKYDKNYTKIIEELSKERDKKK
jgi:hypothetical protein